MQCQVIPRKYAHAHRRTLLKKLFNLQRMLETFDIFKQKYLATFNDRFAIMIGCSYAAMSILQKYISLDPESVERLMSLIIATSLIMAQKAKQN